MEVYCDNATNLSQEWQKSQIHQAVNNNASPESEESTTKVYMQASFENRYMVYASTRKVFGKVTLSDESI